MTVSKPKRRKERFDNTSDCEWECIERISDGEEVCKDVVEFIVNADMGRCLVRRTPSMPAGADMVLAIGVDTSSSSSSWGGGLWSTRDGWSLQMV